MKGYRQARRLRWQRSYGFLVRTGMKGFSIPEKHKLLGPTTVAVLASVALVIPASAAAKNCGKVAGTRIVTHGGVSCKTAQGIYKKFTAGRRLPHGWVCGLSAGACSKGSQGFTFRFNS